MFHEGDLTFGLELCYESHFPEISTVLCLKGAEILFMPHASPRGEPDEKMKSWLRHLPSRAFDNGVFVNPVISPAVPVGKQLLRTSYMASHTDEQMERVLEVYEKVGKQFGLIG